MRNDTHAHTYSDTLKRANCCTSTLSDIMYQNQGHLNQWQIPGPVWNLPTLFKVRILKSHNLWLLRSATITKNQPTFWRQPWICCDFIVKGRRLLKAGYCTLPVRCVMGCSFLQSKSWNGWFFTLVQLTSSFTTFTFWPALFMLLMTKIYR